MLIDLSFATYVCCFHCKTSFSKKNIYDFNSTNFFNASCNDKPFLSLGARMY